MTFEEYYNEHNPKKVSKTEVIINLVLFASFIIYFFYKAIVDCWPILRSNLTYLFSLFS
jgi:hypothetical protein